MREARSKRRWASTVGKLDDRMVVMVWTLREENHRIISLRKANERERAKYGDRVG
ncbi:MAG: BrnT family toxin [Magnetococcales bacterium]|nr:BrnT family toxin [Magnetococcales bacterium]